MQPYEVTQSKIIEFFCSTCLSRVGGREENIKGEVFREPVDKVSCIRIMYTDAF